MNKHELLELYEARGDERDFLAAKPLYEQALADAPNAQLVFEYGYLLECRGRWALGQAVEQYRRAVELDPGADKPRYQLILALAALSQTDEMVRLYTQRLASARDDVRRYRFLAAAHLAAGRYEEARAVLDAGLELAPDDRMLIGQRGEAKAETGDPEGALADWRRALELDESDIWPLYSTAFLLEREGHVDEAIEAWRSIVTWCEDHDAELAAEYPRRELARLRAGTRNLAAEDGS
jgi:tetratricopeptide (TPR) repeat protein